MGTKAKETEYYCDICGEVYPKENLEKIRVLGIKFDFCPGCITKLKAFLKQDETAQITAMPAANQKECPTIRID